MKDAKPDSQNALKTSETRPARSRIRRWILACILICIGVVVIDHQRPWEPRYQGKRLAEWIEDAKQYGDLERRQTAQKILLEIGPAAATELANAFFDTDTKFERRYSDFHNKLPTLLGEILPTPTASAYDNLEFAGEMLCDMGPVAENAWPVLRQSLNSKEGDVLADMFAIQYFRAIVPDDRETVHALVHATLTHSDGGMERSDPFDALKLLLSQNTNAIRYASPQLTAALKSAHKTSSSQATVCLLFRASSAAPQNKAEIVSILRQLARSSDPWHQLDAKITLWKLDPDRVQPGERIAEIRKRLASSDFNLQSKAIDFVRDEYISESPGQSAILAQLIVEFMQRNPRSTGSGIQALGELGPPARATLPLLKELLGDPDIFNRSWSTTAIWQIDRDSETVLPELIKAFPLTGTTPRGYNQYTAADLLAEIGPEARDAAPHLRKHLNHDDRDIAIKVGRALWSIIGETDDLLEILRVEIEGATTHGWRYGHGITKECLQLAGEIGPDARRLVPFIVMLANNPHTWKLTKEQALIALRQIDPDALDQIDPDILKEYLPRIDRLPISE